MSNQTTHIVNEKTLVPVLRFKEFEGYWNNKQLKEICSFFSGGTPTSSNKEYYNGDIPFIGSGNIFDSNVSNFITEEALNSSSAKIVEVGDLLYALYGANSGEVGISKMSGAINQAILCIRTESEKIDFIHCLLVLNKDKIVGKYLQGGQGNLSANIVKKLKYHFPSLPEQQKIASFLSAVDEKIQQLTKKKALLEQYKKGVMQQLFSGQLRFKDGEGKEYPDWEERNLNHYLKVSKTKNENLKYNKNDVLSVSGEFGIVNQIEFQGRSFAGASVHNYGLVENGDIVYTKSPLKSNPYGIIKVNKDKPGIVSTLYAVYKCKPTLIGAYLDYYFQLDDNTNRYLRPLVQKGSKNDMKINNEKVLIDPIMIPSTIEEQQKVVDYLEELDSKITIANNQITQTQTFKKGLLQQLFI